jgi:hypothetical protein
VLATLPTELLEAQFEEEVIAARSCPMVPAFVPR